MVNLFSTNIGDRFVVEMINASKIDIELLRTIGIYEGCELEVISDGYLDGSFVIKIKDSDITLQLNRNIINKLYGHVVKEKRLIK